MKLYIKIKCLVCRGKVMGCHSCTFGSVHIEALPKNIILHINSLNIREKEEIIKKVLDFSGSTCYNDGK